MTVIEAEDSALTRRRAWSIRANWWQGLLLAMPMLFMLTLLVLYPLLRVFIEASSGGMVFERYLDVFRNPASMRALRTTIVDSLIVTAVVGVGAFSIAWTLHITKHRWLRTLLWVVTLVPMFLGVVVKNYAIYIFLSSNGPINSLLEAMGGPAVSLLYSDFAVVVGIAYSLLPYGILSIYAALAQIKPGLLTAAESMGSTRLTAFWTIAVPMARNGLLASMSLVFVLAIGFYVTPILLGGPRTAFVATFISQQINARYDFPGASASAAVLLLVAVIVVGTALVTVGSRTFKGALK